MKFLFVIGRPNCGKSTQAKLFTEQPSLILSPGDWLRSMSAQHDKSDLGSFVFHNWCHESLTPLVIDYLDKLIDAQSSTRDADSCTVILDGFPRNCAEVDAMPLLCRGNQFVIVELIPADYAARERARKRQRGDDDTEEALDIRNESYSSNIERINELAKKHSMPFVRLSCENKSSEEIHKMIVETCFPLMKRLPIPPVPVRRTLARRLFSEARAIESAIVVQRCMKLAQSTRLKKQFFGTHPISLTRANMSRVCCYPYLVALKATGVRYLCYVMNGRLWLLSRSMDVYASAHIEGLEQFDRSLVDGELIGEQEAAYYIVLDCLAFSGVNCMHRGIIERLRTCSPLLKFFASGPLFMRQQEYVARENIADLLSRSSSLPWSIDGIVFQPAKLPYRLGIDYNMFKWKPLGENSVDFYYCEDNSGLYCKRSPATEAAPVGETVGKTVGETVGENITKRPIRTINGYDMVLFGRLLNHLKPRWLRDEMIIECVALDYSVANEIPEIAAEIATLPTWNNDIIWMPQHCRSDKISGNVDWVADGVVQSIRDDITQDEVQHLCIAPRKLLY